MSLLNDKLLGVIVRGELSVNHQAYLRNLVGAFGRANFIGFVSAMENELATGAPAMALDT